MQTVLPAITEAAQQVAQQATDTGLPWEYATWLIGLFVAGIVGMWVWLRQQSKSHRADLKAKDALLEKSAADHKRVLKEQQDRYDALVRDKDAVEREYLEYSQRMRPIEQRAPQVLKNALDVLKAIERGGVERTGTLDVQREQRQPRALSDQLDIIEDTTGAIQRADILLALRQLREGER